MEVFYASDFRLHCLHTNTFIPLAEVWDEELNDILGANSILCFNRSFAFLCELGDIIFLIFNNMELEAGEHVIKEVRKHWLVFFVAVLFLLALAVVPVLMFVFAPAELIRSLPFIISGDIDVLFVFLLLLWFLVLTLVFFFIWTDYYLDVWIITNHRVIDIEQKGFFRRSISSFRLDRIQDITINVHGFVRTIIGFGDINVETAGQGKDFTIPNAAHPEMVKQLILNAYNKAIEKYRNIGSGV